MALIPTKVSVHVSDSEDEDLDDEEDEYGEGGGGGGDPESGGGGSRAALVEKGPPTSVVVPIYRRDCHQVSSTQISVFLETLLVQT